MDTLLVVVTALSLLMAAGMAVVVMKLLREERRRSDARVAMLADWASEEIPPRREWETVHATFERAAIAPQRAPVAASPRDPGPLLDPGTADLPLRPTAVAADPLLETEARGAVTGELFVEGEHPSPWGRRLGVIAAMAIVLVAIGFVLFRGAGPTATEARDAAVAPAGNPAPLELLSLRHAQESQRLTITGLVQNPRGAAPLAHVVATAFAFAADGTFLASGRAPLDFTSLAGGDESPFVVNIPVNGAVARYRVGFRTEDGRVLAHVDKRSDTIAQR